MPQQIISALQRIREDKNGEYTLVLPVNTIEDVFVSMQSNVRLSNLLSDMVADIEDTRLTLVDDMATVITNLAGLIDNRLPLNHLYRENFKTKDFITLSGGTFVEGSVKASKGQKMTVEIKNPIELSYKPDKFKVTQISKYLGSPTIKCGITFNALDAVPTWFDCTNSLVSGLWTNVPEFTKEPSKKYAIKARIQCTCNDSSTYELMDWSVLHV